MLRHSQSDPCLRAFSALKSQLKPLKRPLYGNVNIPSRPLTTDNRINIRPINLTSPSSGQTSQISSENLGGNQLQLLTRKLPKFTPHIYGTKKIEYSSYKDQSLSDPKIQKELVEQSNNIKNKDLAMLLQYSARITPGCCSLRDFESNDTLNTNTSENSVNSKFIKSASKAMLLQAQMVKYSNGLLQLENKPVSVWSKKTKFVKKYVPNYTSKKGIMQFSGQSKIIDNGTRNSGKIISKNHSSDLDNKANYLKPMLACIDKGKEHNSNNSEKNQDVNENILSADNKSGMNDFLCPKNDGHTGKLQIVSRMNTNSNECSIKKKSSQTVNKENSSKAKQNINKAEEVDRSRLSRNHGNMATICTVAVSEISRKQESKSGKISVKGDKKSKVFKDKAQNTKTMTQKPNIAIEKHVKKVRIPLIETNIKDLDDKNYNFDELSSNKIATEVSIGNDYLSQMNKSRYIFGPQEIPERELIIRNEFRNFVEEFSNEAEYQEIINLREYLADEIRLRRQHKEERLSLIPESELEHSIANLKKSKRSTISKEITSSEKQKLCILLSAVSLWSLFGGNLQRKSRKTNRVPHKLRILSWRH